MDLHDATTEELEARNSALSAERDRIKDAQRLITAELDRRAEVLRHARIIAALPDELQGRALAEADPELIEHVGRLRDQPQPPPQMIAPEGIESAEEVGEPGRRWFRRPR